MYSAEGKIIELTEYKKEEIMQKVVSETFARKAYRTLLIAHADYSTEEYNRIKAANNNFVTENDREALENNLILIGIYAL